MAMARKHTLIVIEHDMTFVRQIARTVTVLHEGKMLAEGTVDEVQNDRGDRSLSGPDASHARDRTASIVRTVRPPSSGTWTWQVEPGTVVCLMGRNGVGKTTPAQERDGPAAGPPAARSSSTAAT